jgi:hypothetical protein
MSSTRSPTSRPATHVPKKWAIGIGLALLAYALLQPWLSQQLGWQLPSLVENNPPTVEASDVPAGDTRDQKTNVPDDGTPPNVSPGRVSDSVAEDSQLLYGLLRETEPEDYLSPGGLRYTRGSEQGHRLKHLERHLEDEPGRPGKHGVFYGDMPQLLRWLDEAFSMAKQGVPGTSSRQEGGGRTVYEAKFPQPVGFVGGRDGKRDNHPAAYRIRLVVEGNRVITAFPY